MHGTRLKRRGRLCGNCIEQSFGECPRWGAHPQSGRDGETLSNWRRSSRSDQPSFAASIEALPATIGQTLSGFLGVLAIERRRQPCEQFLTVCGTLLATLFMINDKASDLKVGMDLKGVDRARCSATCRSDERLHPVNRV